VSIRTFSIAAGLVACCAVRSLAAGDAELVLHNGKIITVDARFSVHQAVAVRGNRIVRLGTNEEVLGARGADAELIDLEGRAVIPGLIDSHTHPSEASMTEFDHAIPEMESIADVLAYIAARTAVVPEAEWIQLRQVFITRLRDQRYPTRQELDAIAPKHPVIFSTGPDASLNSLALERSGMDKNFRVTDGGPGFIERDTETGEPTGILRSCTRFVKVGSAPHPPSEEDRARRLLELFGDYRANGITAIVDRDADPGEVARYRSLAAEHRLPIRVAASHHIDTLGPIDQIEQKIRRVAADPLHTETMRDPDAMLRIIGIKTYLDGGMLTGSAYMRQPWGVSRIYAITDPDYRGVLFIPHDRLLPIVRATVASGLQFTAHSVGDGAVDTLLGVYEEIDRSLPIRGTRPCVTHSNFMGADLVEQAARLGVLIDVQPAWLYLDTRTLVEQFGYDRLRYFQPLRSIFQAGGIVCGGSDHMQKIGSLRSVNPYNPFLGMWVTIRRQARWYDGVLHPEESLTREQALRLYTINNARLMFMDEWIGSLEPGKLADFAVLDRDILTCPVDEIRDIQVVETYLNGKRVFRRDEQP
jgi:predicted amidohydrolase YtcJ